MAAALYLALQLGVWTILLSAQLDALFLYHPTEPKLEGRLIIIPFN